MSRGSVGDFTLEQAGGDGSHSLVGARVTHHRATIDQLETASHDDPRDRLDELLARDGVTEAAVLQTCNRVEEYVVAVTAARGRDALDDFAEGVPSDAVAETGHGESLRHLLRVAAGLESQVLGEDQILGQVRRTYAASEEAGALGAVLTDALLKAIHVGERARSETAINEGIVSLGSAAVDVVERDRGLAGRVVVVGAGEVAETVVASLSERGAGGLCIVNRSSERAEALARQVGAEWDVLEALPEQLRAADVVIASTGSATPVIGRASLAAAGETLVVDLGQPRDVAPDVRELGGVRVYDLDDLRAVTRRTHEERREAAEAVERIVDAEYERLVDSYKRKRADAVVRGMYRGAERIKERELARALGKLDDLDPDQRDVVENLADSIVSRLLAVPTESLREAAANDDLETLLAAIELFDPDVDPDRRRAMLSSQMGIPEGGHLPDSASVHEGIED